MTQPDLEALVGRGKFLMKEWIVSTRLGSCWTPERFTASTRGKALAAAFRCDAFEGMTFKQFLQASSCWRDRDVPPRYGDPIEVGGKPAFFISNNRQYVRFVRPDAECVMNAHPYDVLPVEYRPDTYRDRDEVDRARLRTDPAS